MNDLSLHLDVLSAAVRAHGASAWWVPGRGVYVTLRVGELRTELHWTTSTVPHVRVEGQSLATLDALAETGAHLAAMLRDQPVREALAIVLTQVAPELGRKLAEDARNSWVRPGTYTSTTGD